MKKPATKRQQQALLTKQRILECAVELFEKNDFDSVSMEDIATAANSSIGGIYYYFKSKEEIAAYPIFTFDYQYNEFYQEQLLNPDFVKLTALEKITRFFLHVQHTCIENRNLDVLYIYGLQNKNDGALKMSKQRYYYSITHELIRACRREGYIHDKYDDEEIFHMLTVLSRGLFIDWLVGGEKFDMAQNTTRLLEAFFRGVAK